MPEISKPTDINKIWGATAPVGNKVAPSDSKISSGWIAEKPPFENANYLQNRADQFNAHMNMFGFPEWDNVTEYQANKSYVRYGTGIWKCLVTTSNVIPSEGANWTKAFADADKLGGVAASDYARKSQSTTFNNYLEVNNTLSEPFEVRSSFAGNVVTDFVASNNAASNYIRQFVGGTGHCITSHVYNANSTPTNGWQVVSSATGIQYSYRGADYQTINADRSTQEFIGGTPTSYFNFLNSSSQVGQILVEPTGTVSYRSINGLATIRGSASVSMSTDSTGFKEHYAIGSNGQHYSDGVGYAGIGYSEYKVRASGHVLYDDTTTAANSTLIGYTGNNLSSVTDTAVGTTRVNYAQAIYDGANASVVVTHFRTTTGYHTGQLNVVGQDNWGFDLYSENASSNNSADFSFNYIVVSR